MLLDFGEVFERSLGAVQVALALLILSGAWALLHLRRWGALTIQAIAILFLVCLVLFAVVFMRGAVHLARAGMARGGMMIVLGVSLIGLYATPLLLAVRTLRRASVRELLT